MRTFAAACLIASFASTQGHDFSLCNNEPDLFGTSSIELIPDPPMPGKNFTTKTTGTPTITVTGGTSTVTVKALGITVLTTKYDLCVIRKCPIEKGVKTTSELTSALSSATPHGVSCKNKIVNVATDGSAISCVQETITIGDPHRYNATEAQAWAEAMNAQLPLTSPLPVRKCASGFWEVEGEECA